MSRLDRLENSVHFVYRFLVICVLIIIGIEFFTFKLDIFDTRNDDKSFIFKDYKTEWIEDASYPSGGYDTVTIDVSKLEDGSDHIIFYTIHQGVRVFSNDKLIFSQKDSEENLFGKTPGNNWNNIQVYPEDNTIRIDLIPSYSSSKNVIPNIYVGNDWYIYKQIIIGNLSDIFFAFIAIFAGLIFFFWVIYTIREKTTDNNLRYLGEFSIFIGVWKLFDNCLIDLLFPNLIWVDLVPLACLFILLVPYITFLSNLFDSSNGLIRLLVIIASSLFIGVAVVLQIFDIMDFRELLNINQILIVLTIISGLYYIINEIRHGHFTRELYLIIFCLLLCMIGTVIDISRFINYDGRGASSFGILGFDIFILAVGISTLKKSKKLLKLAESAQKYENMAMTDSLTNVCSRTSYEQYINSPDFNFKEATYVMFDLNNLKECNDTMGHDAGDKYITDAARLISDEFSKYGKIFRFGGDEFCAILHNISVLDCAKSIGNMRIKEAEYNKNNPDAFPIHIACGCVGYDDDDYDLHATLRRADKIMYKDKLKIKSALGKKTEIR